MSDAAGPRPAPTSPTSPLSQASPSDEQFTVPIPARREPQTQVLPLADLSGPPPVPVASEHQADRHTAAAPPDGAATTAAPQSAGAAPEPLLAQIGSALFWVTVGWWLTVVVRLLGSLVRTGTSPTMLITNIDHWPEETIVAAVVSVLAALMLLLGRGSRGRDVLGWSAGLLALVTVAVAVWRLLP